MNLPKQLINLLGIVVSAAVLLAGLALGALPMWNESQSTEDSIRSVAQNNTIYDTQVSRLRAATEDIDTITADVRALRAEIPAREAIDDIHELADKAAAAVGGRVLTVRPGDSGAFGADGDDPAPAPAETENADAAPAQETEPPAEPPTTDAAEETSLQQQIPITIEVRVTDPVMASQFLANFIAGPRLVTVQTATVEGLDVDGMTLKISALTFLRTE